MDIEQNQRYATKEIDHCIRILTHMVNNGEDFVALPKEKQIELIKNCGATIQARLPSVKNIAIKPFVK